MAVKASPEDQALLLELQACDTRLAQINHRAKMLPEHAVLQQLATEASALGVTLAERSGTLEDSSIELGRIESDVAVVEARIKRDADRLQTASSVKDVQALEQELAALRKRQGDLEEIELTVMERVDEHTAAVAETRGLLDAIQAKVAEAEAARDASMTTIDAERTNAVANREAIVARIPAELFDLYEKQRARYGWGASLLRGGVSTASGVKLHENEMAIIRRAAPDDVLLCPDSSAILVRTGESGL